MIEQTGQPNFSAAQMTANVDWGTRTINFATTGTTLGNLNTGAVTGSPGHDLTGTLTYVAGVNSFTGAVQAANSGSTNLAGSATGRCPRCRGS